MMAWEFMMTLGTYQGDFHLISLDGAFLSAHPYNPNQIPWTLNVGSSDPSNPDYALALSFFTAYYSTATDLKLLTAGTHFYMPLNGGLFQISISGSGSSRRAYLEPKDNDNNIIANISTIARETWSGYEYLPSFGIMYNDETHEMYMGSITLIHGINNNSYAIQINFYNDRNMWDSWHNNIQPEPTPSTDPYADGGYSTGTDTGTGTFDDTSESVALPTTYAMSATASGLMSQYVMTEANLAAFGNWLWNGGSIVDDLKHFFASPMEAIFSVGMLPFTPTDTTNYHIYVGSLDAGVTGGLVGDTVEKIDCGTIDFEGYYGSALDFNPYTKIEIFLPYCGNFALNPDEVMGHTIGVEYYCDTVSGDCVAFIYDEDRVLYQVKGNCFVQIPLAARDFTAQYSSAIGTVGTVAAGLAASVASGGMTAPVAVGMGTSMAANAMNAKAHVARAGGVSGMAGFMSIQTPYVIITVPNQCLPELQADHQGYPLFVTKRLGDFSGFTKVYEIHLDGLDCTDAEAKEIYDLLKGGVII